MRQYRSYPTFQLVTYESINDCDWVSCYRARLSKISSAYIHFEQQTVFYLWNGYPMTNTIEDDIEFECIGNVLLEEAVSAIDSKIENHCILVFLWYFNIRYILCGNTHDQFNYNEVSLIYIPRTKKITRHIPSTKEFPIFLKYMNSKNKCCRHSMFLSMLIQKTPRIYFLNKTVTSVTGIHDCHNIMFSCQNFCFFFMWNNTEYKSFFQNKKVEGCITEFSCRNAF